MVNFSCNRAILLVSAQSWSTCFIHDKSGVWSNQAMRDIIES